MKLLDFGTSKLIQPDGRFTTTVMATPAYASPEQLRNEAVTTSCDIYGLGAVLFELLAVRPGNKASVATMIERAILEQEPERLTSAVTPESAEKRGLSQNRLHHALQGDLATIVQKCLAPARARPLYIRRRACCGRAALSRRAAVLARPQTTLYWLGKFVRRNRGAVAAAVFVFCVAGALAYAGWRQEQAVREGQRALRMQTFMYRLFKLANSNYTGKAAATIPEFLESALRCCRNTSKIPRTCVKRNWGWPSRCMRTAIWSLRRRC